MTGVFVALPAPDAPPHTDLHLIRAVRRTFPGPAELLHDPVQRDRTGTYLADLVRPYGLRMRPGLFDTSSAALGQSYGEMAAELIRALVPPHEPVDLLVLAFAIHDMLPGRATATYLSHVCPGTPLSFALCDQGSAAAFSGLRVAREYAASAGCRRILLITVEQAVLPYDAAVPVPASHQAVAMLYAAAPAPGTDTPAASDGTGTPAASDGAGGPADPDGPGMPAAVGYGAGAPARVTAVRQHADVAADDVAELAAAELLGLVAGRPDVPVVLGDGLAAAWPAHPRDLVTVAPPGRPSTGVWWALLDALASDPDRPRPVVVADYEPGLRYLCLVAVEPEGPSGTPEGPSGTPEGTDVEPVGQPPDPNSINVRPPVPS